MPAVDGCVQLIHSILCTVLWTGLSHIFQSGGSYECTWYQQGHPRRASGQ